MFQLQSPARGVLACKAKTVDEMLEFCSLLEREKLISPVKLVLSPDAEEEEGKSTHALDGWMDGTQDGTVGDHACAVTLIVRDPFDQREPSAPSSETSSYALIMRKRGWRRGC